MTPLKEMYERLAELKAKETRYSEDEAEISELNSLIALREKYLQRYINHPPHMVERVMSALQPFLGEPMTAETRARMEDAVVAEVNAMASIGQIFGRLDRDDLVYFLNKNLETK